MYITACNNFGSLDRIREALGEGVDRKQITTIKKTIKKQESKHNQQPAKYQEIKKHPGSKASYDQR